MFAYANSEESPMKFLAVGTHGSVDPAEGLRVAPLALTWLRSGLADGSLDCAYSMTGGGRMLIANAESEDALRTALAAAPDLPRTWTITALVDAAESIERYLSTAE
jgi:hypothetical protein